jgi:hypothetical protein
MLCLIQAAKLLKEEILFLIKSHPVMKYEDDIKEVINRTGSSIKYEFLSDKVNLDDYIVLSDSVLLSGTTVGVEAICLGVMPIVFENTSSFNLNPLIDIRDACFFVKNSEELVSAIRSVITLDEDTKRRKENWPSAIRKIFYDVKEDPNARFVGHLKKWGMFVA